MQGLSQGLNIALACPKKMTTETLQIVRSIRDLRATVRDWRVAGLSVGVVPTMGALHDGHLELVRTALAACDRVIVTLFVNPSQFGPNEDFDKYPRNEARDQALVEAEGAHVLFAPSVDEVYGAQQVTEVHVPGLDRVLEGASRPGHFTGVATIVAKLLNQCQADHAFFGEKDYQQLQIISRMATDLNIATEIHGVATVREGDGLALSSRNAYLSADERAIAPALHETLCQVAADFRAGDDGGRLELRARERLSEVGFSTVDYVTIVDAVTLEQLNSYDANRPARVLAAATLGRTRLIDNISVSPPIRT